VESLVATLMPYWEGARVLDLFAGSGSLGLSAREAGCREVVWVEGHARVARALRHRVAASDGGGQVVTELLPRGLERLEGPFDIVLADPPYGDPAGPLTLEALGAGELLSEEAVVVVEHHHKDPYLDSYGTLQRTKVRRFGETALSYYSSTKPAQILRSAQEGGGL